MATPIEQQAHTDTSNDKITPSHQLKSSIEEVIDANNELTPRNSLMQKTGREILSNIGSSTEGNLFEQFSNDLIVALQGAFDGAKRCRSVSTKKPRVWSSFHQIRIDKLPSIWKKFLSSINIASDDPLLEQSVNQTLFEKLLVEHCKTFITASRKEPTAESDPDDTDAMSKDELNILQYAGGYVPHSLLKKYEKRTGPKYEQFVMCLGNMAVHSEHDNLLEYTKEWIGLVNRGGLFPLNNTTFLLFVNIEKQVTSVLIPHLSRNCGSTNEHFQKEVIERVLNNDEVQWHWLLLCQDIDNEKDARELLKDIIILWVTIRGFSICALWMEQYKQQTKKVQRRQLD